MVRYKCPFPNCNYTTSHFPILFRHTKIHFDGYCPFCKRNYRNLLQHASKLAKRCEKHAALWYCLSDKKGRAKKALRKVRDKAVEYITLAGEREKKRIEEADSNGRT